jgi:hypothetical protein
MRCGVIGDMGKSFDLLKANQSHKRADLVDREAIVFSPIISQLGGREDTSVEKKGKEIQKFRSCQRRPMSLSSINGALGFSITIGVIYDSIENMVREEEAKKG